MTYSGLVYSLKGQCPDYAHARASSVFSSILTRQDFLPDCTADGDLLFTFSRNILDFRRSLSSYLKFGSRHEDIAILSVSGPPHEPKISFRSLQKPVKNSFSNVKLVSEVNCSKSSNICLICSRSSLKRLKDINKNAISTR